MILKSRAEWSQSHGFLLYPSDRLGGHAPRLLVILLFDPSFLSKQPFSPSVTLLTLFYIYFALLFFFT